jgi:hypothetical protein
MDREPRPQMALMSLKSAIDGIASSKERVGLS